MRLPSLAAVFLGLMVADLVVHTIFVLAGSDSLRPGRAIRPIYVLGRWRATRQQMRVMGASVKGIMVRPNGGGGWHGGGLIFDGASGW